MSGGHTSCGRVCRLVLIPHDARLHRSESRIWRKSSIADERPTAPNTGGVIAESVRCGASPHLASLMLTLSVALNCSIKKMELRTRKSEGSGPIGISI